MENRHLIASEGMLLTNGGIYVTELWLGDGDSVENWSEITKEEAEAKLKEKELADRIAMGEIIVEDELVEETLVESRENID